MADELTTLPPTNPLDRGAVRPPPGPSVAAAAVRPRKRSIVLVVVMGIFLGLSLVANAVCVIAICGLAAALGAGGADDTYFERVVQAGPSSQKIAVLRIEGIIDEEMAESLRGQIDRAAKDSKVKAVILRINSPGGGLTASDMIHHQVKTMFAECGKPVVAAMDGEAASGGYYVACAAGDIVAQQSTITGSIGVIAEFFFLSGLLKDKLGVTTVTLKMGDQKDWPNLFAAGMTPEQTEYLMETLLKPGYDQFVDVVAASRQMDRTKVLKLATGRIFMAKEAKENGLIDEIGYFERAVALAKERAGLKDARVVEYIQPFRLAELLGLTAQARTMLDLRPERLAGLASPKVMYLWTGY